MSTHPDREELAGYLLGTLPEGRAQGLEEHLQACPACEETIRRMEDLSDTLLQCLRRPPPQGTPDHQPLSDDRAAAEADKPAAGSPPERDAGVDVANGATADFPGVKGYEILSRLGKGGMGVVYKARQIGLNRLVAVKMVLGGPLADEQDIERFHVEAEAAANLDHPGIVRVIEIGQHEGQHYFSMEYIDGESLESRRKIGPLPTREAAGLTEQVARAIAYAHSRGVIHRDLKPANILVDRRNQPRVTDFGLAKRVQGDSSLTATGVVLGTPSYMPPEQAEGHLDEIGERSDVYSLGATLYALLAGRPPFQAATSLETLLQVREREPVSLRLLNPAIPKDLETICRKAMAKRAEDRYRSALELAEDLGRFIAGEAILARRQGLLMRAWRSVRRRPWIASTIAGVGLVLTVSAVLAVSSVRQRHVASLLGSLNAAVDSSTWTARERGEIDATLAAIGPLAPDEARRGRERSLRRLEDFVRQKIGQPNLSADDASAVKELIAYLQQYDAEKAVALRHSLENRWETLLDLTPPMLALDRFFDPAELKSDGRRTACTSTSGYALSLAPSAGSVRWEVTFDDSWEHADAVGLLLDADAEGKRGYSFLLRGWIPANPLEAKQKAIRPSTLEQIREAKGLAELDICRDGLLLDNVQIPLERIPPGPLRVAAVRIGDKLSWEVGDLPAVTFRDLTAFRNRQGVLALRCSSGIGVTRLRALHQTSPARPEPLERGDRLFTQGDYAGACRAFEELVDVSPDADTRQEARYKAAQCLIALQRNAEAEELLGGLAGEDGRCWPALSALELWLRCVRQNRLEEGEKYFSSLSLRYTTTEIANLLPSDVRTEIVATYVGQAKGVNLYRSQPVLLRRVELAAAIARYFAGTVGGRGWNPAYVEMIRALRAVGREQDALALAGELMERHSLWGASVSEYSWLLRVAGRSAEALQAINRGLADSPPIWPGWREQGWPNLMVEKARVLAALERWDEADRILDDAIRVVAPQDMIYDYASLCALRGYFRQRRGDEAGARQAWKESQRHDWIDPGFGMRCVNGWIQASLIDELTEQQAHLFAQRLLSRVFDSPRSGTLANLVLQTSPLSDSVAPAMRDAFRTPRGREYAKKLVFQEVPFADVLRLPPMLLASTALCKGAFADDLTEQEDNLAWQIAGDLYSAFVEKSTLGKGSQVQLSLAWTGTTNSLGWAGIASKLEPEVRGRVALVLGYRYLRLNRLDDARLVFQVARQDIPPDSPWKNMAEQKLRDLDASDHPSKKGNVEDASAEAREASPP